MIIVLSPSHEYSDYYRYNTFDTKEEAIKFLETEHDYLENYIIL